MSGSGRRRAAAFAAFGIALAAVLANAPAALAADPPDQLQDVGKATYELVPARHVVRVTVVFDLTNKAPSKTTSRRCSGVYFDPYYGAIPYTTTCRYRTDYYYFAYSVYIEADAAHVKVEGSSGTASAKLFSPKGNWRKITIRFTNLYYGKTRRLTLTYDLPAGGPRATTSRRAGYGYTSFCGYGPGSDRGSLRIVLPTGFKVRITGSLRSVPATGRLVWASASVAKPWQLQSCVEGPNDDLDTTTSVPAPGGGTISVQAWRDDPAWAGAMTKAAREDLPRLVELLGPVPYPGNLTIREQATVTGTDRFDPSSGTLSITELHQTEADGVRRLARLWFDEKLFDAAWLRDGYADWATVASGAGSPACSKPGPHPLGSKVGLAAATGITEDTSPGSVRAWERQAGCYVIKTIDDAIGRDRMLASLAWLRGGAGPYDATADGAGARTSARTWRDWLDVVELRGLVPAGADRDLAATLLREYGAASTPEVVAERRAALTAYDALVARIGTPPALVTTALSTWSFDDAGRAMAAAGTAWDESSTVLATFAGLDPAAMPVRSAIAGAQTQADLDAASDLGGRQVTLAKDAADARAMVAAPRDVIQEIGLLGAGPPNDADLVRAVAAVDAAATSTWTSAARALIGGARDAGLVRIAIAVALVVALVLLALVVRWVRRRRRRNPAAAPLGPEGAGAD